MNNLERGFIFDNEKKGGGEVYSFPDGKRLNPESAQPALDQAAIDREMKRLEREREELLDELAYRSLKLQRMSESDPQVKKLKNDQGNLRNKLSRVEEQLFKLDPVILPEEVSDDVEELLGSTAVEESEAPNAEVSAEELGDAEEREVTREEAIRQLEENIKIARSEIKSIQESNLSPVEQEERIAEVLQDIKQYRADIIEITSAELDEESIAKQPPENLPTVAEKAAPEREPIPDDVIDLPRSEWRRLPDDEAETASLPDYSGLSRTAPQHPRLPHLADEQTEVSFEAEPRAIEEEKEEALFGETEEEIEAKQEYVQRKREFKQARQAYMTALEQDYADRNIFKKVLGLGRKELSPDVERAYDTFMAANQAYYNFAQRSGHYERVATRLNRDRAPKEQLPLNSLVADRHILQPAQERLELQKLHMPEGVSRLKQAIVEKIRKNPKTALGVGALLTVLNPAAVLTGLGVRYVGNKFYVGSKEATEKQVTDAAIDAVEGVADLRALEEQQFESARQTHDARIRTNAVAVGAAVAAGGAYGSSGEEAVLPSVEDVTLPDTLSGDEIIGSTLEGLYTVERGDTMSQIMLESIRERVLAGELKLPPGVDIDHITHHLYQSFPEMTNATDVSPRLSPAEWQTLGVASGDPQLISPGENINVEGLIEKLWGTSSGTSATAEVVPPTVDVVAPAAEVVPPTVDVVPPAAEVVPPAVDAPMPEVEAVPAQPVSETVVLDRTTITAEGDMVFQAPEGFAVGTPMEVVSPFSNEVPYVKMPGEELIDVMMQRIEADVRSGVITLDAGQDMDTLREQLLDRYPELKQPDEVLWFQRTANPGLTPEVWKEIGIPGGDPLEIPDGTAINMDRLLNEVFDFKPEGEVTPEPSTPSPAAETVAVGVSEASPVEATETTPISQYDQKLQEMLGDTRDPKMIEAALAELAKGYQPVMSERLAELTTPWRPGQSLHEHLYRTMLESYRAGDINLPLETMKNVQNNETALYGFIERHLPDVSEGVLSKFFRGVGPDALSPSEWRELGIESGDPQMIAAGEKVQTGNIIKLLLERAASATNKP